jgi:hypothetical protein
MENEKGQLGMKRENVELERTMPNANGKWGIIGNVWRK